MNKIFTLFTFAALAVGAQAAAPELLFRGAPVADGATCQAGYTLEVLQDEIPGWGVFTNYQYTQDTHMSVRGDKSKEVTVSFESNVSMQFCGIVDQCNVGLGEARTAILGNAPQAAIDGNTATAPLLIDKITDDFEGADPAAILSEITVKVTAYYTSSPAEKTTVTVNLLKVADSELGGVVSVGADNASVKYLRGVIDYNVASPSKLEVYSTSGALVISKPVSGVGSVALDSLRPGVYIYSLAGKTGKFLLHK